MHRANAGSLFFIPPCDFHIRSPVLVCNTRAAGVDYNEKVRCKPRCACLILSLSLKCVVLLDFCIVFIFGQRRRRIGGKWKKCVNKIVFFRLFYRKHWNPEHDDKNIGQFSHSARSIRTRSESHFNLFHRSVYTKKDTGNFFSIPLLDIGDAMRSRSSLCMVKKLASLLLVI